VLRVTDNASNHCARRALPRHVAGSPWFALHGITDLSQAIERVRMWLAALPGGVPVLPVPGSAGSASSADIAGGAAARAAGASDTEMASRFADRPLHPTTEDDASLHDAATSGSAAARAGAAVTSDDIV